MLYDVTLRFGYDYPAAVKDARHILRIRPLASARQSVPAQSVRIVPEPDEAVHEHDFFGNDVDHIRLHRPHETLSIEMRARVKAKGKVPDLTLAPSLNEVRRAGRQCRDTEALSPVHFLGASRLLPVSDKAEAYARTILSPDGEAPSGAAVLRLTQAIRTDFTYAPGTTRIDTAIDEVMRLKRGVCQDFAHAMIAALRGCAIPAAYVSGFLRTEPPPGRPRLEGSDAMHAWVSVWLGDDLGWTGFDPTNGVATGTDHIEVAIGRDYADVAPIGGVVITSGPQKARHSVDVVPVGETPTDTGTPRETLGA